MTLPGVFRALALAAASTAIAFGLVSLVSQPDRLAPAAQATIPPSPTVVPTIPPSPTMDVIAVRTAIAASQTATWVPGAPADLIGVPTVPPPSSRMLGAVDGSWRVAVGTDVEPLLAELTDLHVSALYGAVINPQTTSDQVTTCTNVDVVRIMLFVDTPAAEGELPPPGVDVRALAFDARVVAAPLDESAGWLIEFASPEDAVVVSESLAAGAMLYLHPAC